jgi:LEA14-like dessication related protein/cbb3-type cytochrome oxidase subunit 3
MQPTNLPRSSSQLFIALILLSNLNTVYSDYTILKSFNTNQLSQATSFNTNNHPEQFNFHSSISEERALQLADPTPCNARPNCTSCIQSYSCHWCGSSEGCHSKGSIYGCFWGTDCTAECFRTEPEKIGYGPFPVRNVMIFVSVSVAVLLIILCCFYGCCYFYQRRLNKRRNQQAESIDLTPFIGRNSNSTVVQTRTTTLRNPSTLNDSNSSNRTVISISGGGGNSPVLERNFDENREWTITGNNQLSLKRLYRSSWFTRFCRCMCSVTVLAIVLFIIMGIYFFPSLPGYSICSKKIEYTSVLEAIVNTNNPVIIDLHTAIYNPNRFEVHVNKLDATVLYAGIDIGSGSISNVVLNAGSINDLMVAANFYPSKSLAASILPQHLAGKLIIDVNLRFSTNVWLFNHNLGGVNTSYTVRDINVDEAGGTEYCKCK